MDAATALAEAIAAAYGRICSRGRFALLASPKRRRRFRRKPARAVQAAIQAERGRRWLEDNRAAIDAQNAWVEEHGLPLARYRMF